MIATFRYFFLGLLLAFMPLCCAEASQLGATHPWQQWTFSGSAQDEEGKIYYYYFVYQQNGVQRMVNVLVLSDQLKPIIRYQKNSKKLSKGSQKPNSWKLGRSFFRFSPITQSWVFGLKTNKDKGFNFKVNVYPLDGDMGVRQSISKALNVEMNQFRQMNGHVFFADQNSEKFVSAKRGWVRYIEGAQPPNQLIALLCNHQNGSGLYSLRYESAQAKKAAIAGWRSDKGEREMVSQFINITQRDDSQWVLTIPNPKTNSILHTITSFINEPFHTYVIATENGKGSLICFYQAAHI